MKSNKKETTTVDISKVEIDRKIARNCRRVLGVSPAVAINKLIEFQLENLILNTQIRRIK